MDNTASMLFTDFKHSLSSTAYHTFVSMHPEKQVEVVLKVGSAAIGVELIAIAFPFMGFGGVVAATVITGLTVFGHETRHASLLDQGTGHLMAFVQFGRNGAGHLFTVTKSSIRGLLHL